MHKIKIHSIEAVGLKETYDIWNRAENQTEPNFVANGLVVHNSIPKALENRDSPTDSWKLELRKLHPIFEEVLSTTLGILCFHEKTRISMADGTEKIITDIKAGDEVFSVNKDTLQISTNVVECCGPTRFGKGIEIELSNGYKFITTPDHRIPTFYGDKRSDELSADSDLIGIPNQLRPVSSETKNVNVDWLGRDTDVSYLIGLLIGDGLLSGTGIHVCCGNIENNCDLLRKFILESFPDINIHKYFHCRSFYLCLSTDCKIRNEIILKPFEDTYEWWSESYSKYSGQDISTTINKSTWWVYKKLREHGITITKSSKNPHRSKFIDLLNNLNLRCSVYHKRIPEYLYKSSDEVKYSFLAGLIDSDDTTNSKDEKDDVVCHITSCNQDLLQDIRCLCTSLGITTHIGKQRIYIWSTDMVNKFIEPYMILKSCNGILHDGESSFWLPRQELINKFVESGLPKRVFARSNKISRVHLKHKSKWIKKTTAEKLGLNRGDISWVRIKSVREIDDLYFWNLSVENDHTVIANGVYLNQCYQEQLTALWQRVGNFSASEAQAARKDIAKKRVDKIGKIREMWIEGASRSMGREEAIKYFDEKIYSFARYAFNRCLYIDTVVTDVITGQSMTIGEWYSRCQTPHLRSFDGDATFIDECIEIHDTGVQEVFEIEFENGKRERVTMNHRFMCSDGEFHEVREIIEKNLDVTEINPG
jgi:intein/homing endonuclease